jgi:hypothetical protein
MKKMPLPLLSAAWLPVCEAALFEEHGKRSMEYGDNATMTFKQLIKAVLTDIHFLIPLAVLCAGVVLLIKLS